MTMKNLKSIRVEEEVGYQMVVKHFRITNENDITVSLVPFGEYVDEEDAKKMVDLIIQAPMLLECVEISLEYLEKQDKQASILYRSMEQVYKKAKK